MRPAAAGAPLLPLAGAQSAPAETSKPASLHRRGLRSISLSPEVHQLAISPSVARWGPALFSSLKIEDFIWLGSSEPRLRAPPAALREHPSSWVGYTRFQAYSAVPRRIADNRETSRMDQSRSGKEWQLRCKMRSRGRKAERLSSVSEIVPGCRQLASWSFKTGSYYAGTAARSKAAAIRARV